MNDANLFGKFVPGFDFLQNLAKGAAGSIPQLPNPASWVAPTLNVEELDKRISELKTVQFWLDQNGKALAATITALEVQKMTLATLKGMNFNMGDLANAFKLKASDAMASAKVKAAETAAPKQSTTPAARKKTSSKAAEPPASAAGLIDPMQLWGSLTQQFSQIASSAMKDAAKQTAIDSTKNMAKAMTETALNTAKTAGAAAAQTMQRMTTSAMSPHKSTPTKAAKKVAAHTRQSSVKGKKK
jgi:hypothetical protein